MQKQCDGYKVVPFSEGRQIVSAINGLGEQKHIIHGLVEVDVTGDWPIAYHVAVPFHIWFVAGLGRPTGQLHIIL